MMFALLCASSSVIFSRSEEASPTVRRPFNARMDHALALGFTDFETHAGLSSVRQLGSRDAASSGVSSGSSTVKREPSPSVLATSMRPPCTSTIQATKLNPSPKP